MVSFSGEVPQVIVNLKEEKLLSVVKAMTFFSWSRGIGLQGKPWARVRFEVDTLGVEDVEFFQAANGELRYRSHKWAEIFSVVRQSHQSKRDRGDTQGQCSF